MKRIRMLFEKALFNAGLFFISFILCFLSTFPIQGTAQALSKKQVQIKILSVGDSCPETVLKNIVNSIPEGKMADLKGKVIIIDFWATWCSGCVEFLPVLESIQRDQKEILQVISVTDEKEDKIKKFVARNELVKQLKLPMIVEDTLLSKSFPHFIIPHEVWIVDGVVRAYTSAEYVTKQNIQQMHANPLFARQWPIKRDILNFDRKKPLIDFKTQGSSRISYSTLTGYIEGVPYVNQGFQSDSSNNWQRLFAINSTIPKLYTQAIGDQLEQKLPMNKRIIVTTGDAARYYKPDSVYMGVWERSNKYTYEAILPLTTSLSEAKDHMFNDLNLYLGLDAKIELKESECLILKRIANINLAPDPTNKLIVNDLALTSLNKRLLNQQLANLKDALNNIPNFFTVIDETDYNGPVDINLGNVQLTDIPTMNDKLKRYGLELKKEKRLLKVLVIREKMSDSKINYN